MKRKTTAFVLFGVFVAFALGYVLGVKERTGTFSVLGAKAAQIDDDSGSRESEPPDALPSASALPASGEATPSEPDPPAAPSVGDIRIDVNAASAEQLTDLPGIGPVLARRIVEWRTENGPFENGDDLMKVKGIGENVWGDMEPFVVFG